MRAARLVLAALALILPCRAGDNALHEEYRARRDVLVKALPDGVIALFGRTESQADESRSGFAQEPNFFYLTGWSEPGAALLLAAPDQQGGSGAEEILLLPLHNSQSEKYTGRRDGPDDAHISEITGFDRVLPFSRFEAELARLLESRRKIYTLTDDTAAKLRPAFPLREVADGRDAVWKQRLGKSSREIELIQKSADASIAAHRAAWKRIAPGLFEYQVAATMVGAFLELGCQRSAYDPIVASGPNANVLHYSANSRQMESGDLLLMDVGAECSGYAADITRTVPVSGKFTARQRELYEIVLGAEKAVIEAVKPGMTFDREGPAGLTGIAYGYINTHGKDKQGEPLGQYFIHKVGHHVGLEVHDAGGLLTYGPLEPGMVITVEPGIYIPEEGIGIRIEDMLLVTETGSRVLTSALPREPEEIEKAPAK